MNQLNTLLTVVLVLYFGTTNLYAQNVNIPDANFKANLVRNTSINTNNDAEIQLSEAVAFSGTINCFNQNIADLTGIEAFVNLTNLNCSANNLSNLDVSQNTNLTDLDCENNNLSNLDVTQNVNLTTLNCTNNPIYTLDVSLNVNLRTLDSESNDLSSLDVSQNVSLEILYCSNNDLTGLDLSQNPNLTDIDFRNNNINNIDFSQNTNLSHLTCNSNDLITLDLSQNVNLTYLSCYNNDLTTLDLNQNVNLGTLNCRANPIRNLDLTQNANLTSVNCEYCNLSGFDIRNGNNSNLTLVYLYDNPNLSCINVDDVAYSTLNWTHIDQGASFSTNCAPPIVAIPNANFKANLVGNAAINTNGDAEIQLSEATAFNGTINCSNLNITDLTGLEAFPNLRVLNCNSNNLDRIDLHYNIGLEELYCTNNNLRNLSRNYYNLTPGVSLNVHLRKIDCSFNPIRTLDLTQNTDLVEVACESCNLNTLDLKNGNNTNITVFNALNNPNLNCINVDDAAYSTANWTNLDAIASFNVNCSPAVVNIPDASLKSYLVSYAAINTNGDGEIQYSEAINSSAIIDCSNRGITDMTGIEAFYRIGQLYCQNNNISNLDLSQNDNLTIINCVNNNLSNLDVRPLGRSIRSLFCASNPLLSLDVTQNINLEKLYAGTTQLTSLDLNQNFSLTVLDCASAQLSDLKLKNNNNTRITTFRVTNNPNLNCIEVDDSIYSTTNWTNIDPTAFFSTNCNSPNALVYIPDANFKAYLVANAAINTNGDAEIQVSEAVAFTGTINCAALNIADLLGIEAFVNLTNLNCASNTLSNLGLNQNTSLISLDCSANNLSSLVVSQNTGLTSLNCSSNNLNSLAVNQNTNLLSFDCSSNNLGALDLRQNTSLTTLNCSSNNLSGLDLRNGNNTNMSVFDARSNSNLGCIDVDDDAYALANWTNIDVTASFSTDCSTQNVYIPNATFKNILITNTSINTSGDNEIQFSEAAAFAGTIDCSANSITDLTGIEAFVNLNQLRCHRNNLTSLDLSQNTSLTQLYCYNNQISSINLTQNTNLVVLHCVNNLISNIDLTQNTNLATLYCSTNPMYNLDLSQNTNLRILDCAANQLSSLNIKNGNNTNITTFRANANSSLTCIEVDDAAYSTANWTTIDPTASFNTNCSSLPPVVYIPNTNFKAYLVGNTAINTNGDNEIQFSEAAAFNGKIDCYNLGINDFTGIEEFVNLSELDCSFNNVGSLDLSQNVNLEWLDYSGTGLMNLDLSQNIALRTLLCASIATVSSLTNLDVSHNVNLESLSCDNNALTSLDLTQNTNLTTLYCYANQITSLDLSQNTSLTIVNCSYNQITTLDLSQNANLVNFSCTENQLTSLNVSNGNNTNIVFFEATVNPNLSCIEVDDAAYSTANWTNIDAGASFNINCSSPPAPIVNIPDANFKAYLVGNATINTNGDAEIQVTEATAFTGTINCSSLAIVELTGIEAFVNLTDLVCRNNHQILSIDLSQNTSLVTADCSQNYQLGFINIQGSALRTLNCSGCEFYGLNVSQATGLVELNCSNNPSIDNLNLSQNINLERLYCTNTDMSNLDLSQNANLEVLECNFNSLTNLDLHSNTNLTAVNCSFNSLTSLDIKNGNNTSIISFDASGNNLSCIQVDDAAYSTANWTSIDAGTSFSTNCSGPAPIVNIPDANFKAYLVGNPTINTNGDAEIQVTEAMAFTGTINCPNLNIADVTGVEAFVNLTQLRCNNNNISTIDLSQNTSLIQLLCYNNNINNLDLTQNTSLAVLHCVGNPISNLDLSQNTALTRLFCSSTSISSLDLSQNVNLQRLYCGSTSLTSLDLSLNTELIVLDCASTQLSSLDLRNGRNTDITTFKAGNNPNLSCIQVDDPAYSTTNWTNIDAGTSFGTNCNGAAPIVNIPDANFKAYLLGNTSINTNGDTEIQVSEASVFGGRIDCPNLNIADLTGIEAFVNLTQLVCYNNNLTSLNVNQNTSLTWIHCVNNSIASLDVTQNTSLTLLYCSKNQLTNLDLTQNTNLKKLYGATNQLSSLNVKNGNNTNISIFQVIDNPNLSCIEVDYVAYSTANWTNIDATAAFNTNCSGLAPIVTIPDANFKAYLVGNTSINTNGDTEIQVSEATAFAGTIDCSTLNIADLRGIEAFVNLTTLDCSSNQLGDLDLSQNTSLTSLDCASNQLSDLDVRNGNNVNVTYFDARNNASLTCIEVDNATYSTTNWTNIDATTSFSVVCGAPIVTIPDANFKAYLLGNNSINTNGDAEIQVSEATAFGGRINCPNLNIADLTGIEAFVNLTQLVCYNNNLTSLDLSQNTNLTWIHCVNNSISSLNVSQNANLGWLYCSKNPLGSLDLTQNLSLTKLYCSSAQLTSLNVKNGNNGIITIFNAIDNPNLSCIEVDDVAYSTANWTNIDATASFSTNCAVPMANASNSAGNNANNTTGIESEVSTSISTINKEMNLSAYPNPTTKNITLDFGKMYKEAQIQVINLTGQTILSQELSNVSNATLELEGAKGIYFVNIQTEEGTATLKVVKE